MANLSGWKLYKQALVSACPPNESADVRAIHTGDIWKNEFRTALFARWTSQFDCGYETPWWYVIKDSPFDILAVNSNTRYKINKGRKIFRVERIDPGKYIDQIYEVQVAAYSQYPSKYRPAIDKEKLERTICNSWTVENVWMYGAFYRETEELAGYVLMTRNGNCLNLVSQKAVPAFEKHQVNAAMVAYVLETWEPFLRGDGYICDGERNIQHETQFQDYLERYFCFRKAYCKLHIAYNPRIKWIVKLLYRFRKVLLRLDDISLFHKINGVLKMETITRNCEE